MPTPPSSSRPIIAVDPGSVSGAYAVIYPDGAVAVADLPVMDKQVDAATFAKAVKLANPTEIVIERVSSMPKQGVASTFKFGMGTGIVHGIVGALGIPLHMVTPPVWKKGVGLQPGADKEASRAMAIRLYPNVEGLDLKKHSGRAEALLLGRYWLANRR